MFERTKNALKNAVRSFLSFNSKKITEFQKNSEKKGVNDV